MGGIQDFGVFLGLLLAVPLIFLFMCYGVGAGSGLGFISDWCTHYGTTVDELYQFVSIAWALTLVVIYVGITYIRKWGQ